MRLRDDITLAAQDADRRSDSIRSGGLVLGPLPTVYRWLISAIALLVCIGLGAWLAYLLPIPLLARAGAGIGAALGVVVVVLLLHEFGSGHPERARVRARHRSR